MEIRNYYFIRTFSYVKL